MESRGACHLGRFTRPRSTYPILSNGNRCYAKRRRPKSWRTFSAVVAAGCNNASSAIQAAQINNYDYAVDLLTQCVVTDPGNQIYVQSFLGTLERKYNNNKKGSTLASIRTAGTKTQILNSLRKKDWLSVIKSSLEVLKLNPWDTSTLVHIAKACGELRFFDCQLFYLKSAQDADPKSMSVHREGALAATSPGRIRSGNRLLDQSCRNGQARQHRFTRSRARDFQAASRKDRPQQQRQNRGGQLSAE